MSEPAGGHPTSDASDRLSVWLERATGAHGPYGLQSLSGGNSNDTVLASGDDATFVMRRPPAAGIDATAHNIGRELEVLRALETTSVPVPRPLGLCDDPSVPEAPFLLMEAVDGISLRDSLPPELGDPGAAVRAVAEAVVEALADLHAQPWRELGLARFGKPEGFLPRQVGRWRKQFERHRHRDLSDFDAVAIWLEENRPLDGEPAILHGDFHVDNCLFGLSAPPLLRAIIDWEMATIGDPLLDVGLLLAFWGDDRSAPMAMPAIQGLSRFAGAPRREELAARYEALSGRSLDRLDYYMALAFWKLAAIVEGAHHRYVRGELESEYAAALEHDVPALLREARYFAGI